MVNEEILYKVGLNENDINVLEGVNKAVINTNFIVNLLIKAHNHGFKKGTAEVMEVVKEVQNERGYF